MRLGLSSAPHAQPGHVALPPSPPNRSFGEAMSEPCKCDTAPEVLDGITPEAHEALHRRIVELVEAIRHAAELYGKPTGYRPSKGRWSMNTSIGFETRFENLVRIARKEKPR